MTQISLPERFGSDFAGSEEDEQQQQHELSLPDRALMRASIEPVQTSGGHGSDAPRAFTVKAESGEEDVFFVHNRSVRLTRRRMVGGPVADKLEGNALPIAAAAVSLVFVVACLFLAIQGFQELLAPAGFTAIISGGLAAVTFYVRVRVRRAHHR